MELRNEALILEFISITNVMLVSLYKLEIVEIFPSL